MENKKLVVNNEKPKNAFDYGKENEIDRQKTNYINNTINSLNNLSVQANSLLTQLKIATMLGSNKDVDLYLSSISDELNAVKNIIEQSIYDSSYIIKSFDCKSGYSKDANFDKAPFHLDGREYPELMKINVYRYESGREESESESLYKEVEGLDNAIKTAIQSLSNIEKLSEYISNLSKQPKK